MRSFLVVFNHGTLLESQIDFIEKSYGIYKNNIIYLNKNLSNLWSNFDPFENKVDISSFEQFILDNSKKGDIVLVQGDFGATVKLVNFCTSNERVPVYATSKRESIEEIDDNGDVIKRSIFKFVRFREYRV
ncbi:MAG: hypothetical protein CR982_10515 [Candidatus Cloacimonadota bacterium]|nr:MAG: hypothetical protein CR982_10515 [Candidatus Cloacimonadota bacterium]PIE78647.1 MAG: hypothetical protein CSA15_07115 [Candidatus Delongbacteria bacterium]